MGFGSFLPPMAIPSMGIVIVISHNTWLEMDNVRYWRLLVLPAKGQVVYRWWAKVNGKPGDKHTVYS